MPDGSFAAVPTGALSVAWASLGPVVIGAAGLIGALHSEAQRVGWALANDVLNLVSFAARIVDDQGIAYGSRENPVPFPAVAIALATGPGRPEGTGRLSVAHDAAAIAGLWLAVLLAVAFLAGICAATVTRASGGGPRVAGAAAALASLLPATWIFSGYAMEYGFFNSHLALVVLLAALIVGLDGARESVLPLCAQLVAATLALATWSPLVVLPLSTAVVLAIRSRGRRALWSRGRAVIVLLSGVQLVAYALVGALPPFLDQREALSGLGGIYRFPAFVLFGLLVGVVLMASTLAIRRRAAPFATIGAWAVGAAVGVLVLLYISRRMPDPWTYYPLKYAWIVALVVMVLAVGLLSGILATRRGRAVGLVAAMGGVIVVFLWVPPGTDAYTPTGPLERLSQEAQGQPGLLTTQVLLEVSRAPDTTLLWRTDRFYDVEVIVDHWITQVESDDIQSDLRLAGTEAANDKSVGKLCEIAGMMEPGLRILTNDDGLEAEVASACPRFGMTFQEWRPPAS